MESPGEYLKRERELRGISLASIHAATRIPMKYLAAIEADDFEKMPHPAFVKGFIKSYCRHMGVDETDAVLRYEVALREQMDRDEKPESSRSAPMRFKEARLPLSRRTAVIIGVAVLLVIILAVSLALRKRHKAAPSEEKKAESAVTPAGPVKDAAAQGAKAAGETKTAAQAPQAKAQPEAAAPAIQQGAKAPAEGSHTLYVYAIEPVWLKIKIDNAEPFDVSFHKGQGALYKATGTFSLVVGNAGGVSLTYDGKKFRKPGRSGEVVRLKFPSDDQKAGPTFR